MDGKAPQLSAAVGRLSAEATGALDMPRTLKAFLCLAAMDLMVPCLAGTGFALHQETYAGAQIPARQQFDAQLSLAHSAVEFAEGRGMEPGVESRSTKFEACARVVREDYSDDPERAEGWIATPCHR